MQSLAIWILAAMAVGAAPAFSQPADSPFMVATAPQANSPPADDKAEQLTPRQKMDRRFPQPVRAGSLIGLPVLDWQDSTIGYIRQVVRTPDGQIKLIVPYSRWFGWLGDVVPADRWRRRVAVPIETVAILARQVDALDMSRQDFDAAATFMPSEAAPVPAGETIQIAISRR
jgi:hypothetical protein